MRRQLLGHHPNNSGTGNGPIGLGRLNGTSAISGWDLAEEGEAELYSLQMDMPIKGNCWKSSRVEGIGPKASLWPPMGPALPLTQFASSAAAPDEHRELRPFASISLSPFVWAVAADWIGEHG